MMPAMYSRLYSGIPWASCADSPLMNHVLGKTAPRVEGIETIEAAKMTGITPPELTLSGRCVACPPYTRRPTTRLAYCTGIFLCPRSTKTTAATTTTMTTTRRMNGENGPVRC